MSTLSVDLLAKGWEVFRAVSPACSCDLIAAKGGTLLRIKVRTRRKYPTGKVYYPAQNIRADLIAIVLPDMLIYEQPLEDGAYPIQIFRTLYWLLWSRPPR